MTAEPVERRLAAVLAADIAGYSLLMGRDEEGTLSRLKAFRKTLVDPTITAHRGRIVKTTGDGMLVEFASAVDAARCAVEVQRGVAVQNAGVPLNARIEFRIGIHVGDIIFDDNDIFGDGVNIAARLEGIAEPGGICISDDAQRQIRGKLDSPPFEDMGPQNLKNIAEPMRAWRLSVDAKSSAYLSGDRSAETAQTLALPDKPSIAVLPFQNMSSDAEQEYFADGTVEDIITALSRYPSLFVIARNSSFTCKGQAVDVKRIGRELGVRYVLEGSVRKVRDRVRVTGQLIDASTGAHLWADRFEGGLEDIFDLQDDITLRVVGAIAPKLEQAEIVRAMRKPTESLDGYDYYLRAMSNFHKGGREDISEALRLFRKAIEFDDKFSSANGMAAWCYARRKMNGWADEGSSEGLEAERLAGRAVKCGNDDAVALASSGIAIGYMFTDFDRAVSLLDRAQALNPNLAMAWHLGAGLGASTVSRTLQSSTWSGPFVLALSIRSALECWPPLRPPIFRLDVLMLPHRFQRLRCWNNQTILLLHLSQPQQMRWLEILTSRLVQWSECANSIQFFAFIRSSIVSLTGDPKRSLYGRTPCAEQDYPSDPPLALRARKVA